MRRDSLIYALASTPASKAWMRRAAYASSSGDHLPRRCCDEGDGAGRADDDGAGEAMSPATWARERDGHYAGTQTQRPRASASQRDGAPRKHDRGGSREGATHSATQSLYWRSVLKVRTRVH